MKKQVLRKQAKDTLERERKLQKNSSGSTSPEEKRPRTEGKIVQCELFGLRGINASDWIDSSDGSQYVPPSTPSSDLIPSSDSPEKKRPRKK